MRAGLLRHVVTIQTLTEAVNSVGERTKSWADTTTRRASIETLGGNEGDGKDQTRATASHLFTMRYYAGLSMRTNRITWNSRTFGIEHVDHADGREFETRVRCAELRTP